jgi:hypothetical protein
MKSVIVLCICILTVAAQQHNFCQSQKHVSGTIILDRVPATSHIRINDSIRTHAERLSFVLPEGRHHIIVSNPSRIDYRRLDYDTVVTLRGGETLRLICRFPEFVTIETQPFGADVYENGMKIGRTPLWFERSGSRNFELIKKGYTGTRVVVDDSSSRNGRIMVALNKINPAVRDNPNLYKSSAWKNRGEKKFQIPLMTTLTLAVLSGAAAAYSKKKADDYFEKAKLAYYFGDFSNQKRLEKKTRRYDRYAKIGFIGLQVNFVASVYFLFRMN